MKKFVVLSVAALIATLSFASGPSHSAQKGRATPGKSTAPPPSKALMQKPDKGKVGTPGGKGVVAQKPTKTAPIANPCQCRQWAGPKCIRWGPRHCTPQRRQ